MKINGDNIKLIESGKFLMENNHSKNFINALKKGDIAEIKKIPKSDRHNHLPLGGRLETIPISADFKIEETQNEKLLKEGWMIAETSYRRNGIFVNDGVEDLYKTCHYVSLHIPANEKTKKSINKNLLGLMPKGATLLNTARKEVVCEEGLKFMLETRPDFKYASDIAPDNAGELNEKFAGRVYFTPKKMGAQTSEANDNAAEAAISQIVRFFEKGDITFKVN